MHKLCTCRVTMTCDPNNIIGKFVKFIKKIPIFSSTRVHNIMIYEYKNKNEINEMTKIIIIIVTNKIFDFLKIYLAFS